MGGVSTEVIVHFPKYKFGLSIHSGKTFPISNYGKLYDGGIMFGIDLSYNIAPRFSLVGFLGYNEFKSAVPLLDDTYWLNLSANIKYEFSTNSTRPFINFGPGLYFPESGSVEAGINLGFGIDVTLSPRFVAEAAVDYHNIFTPGTDIKFYTAHIGLIFRF